MTAKKPCVIELKDNGEYQSLVKGEVQTYGMKAGRVFLQPGEECGEHSTGDREEILVFLQGQGTAIIGAGEAFEVGAGKIAYITPQTTHNIKNTGTEPLAYVFCVAPVAGAGKK